MVEEGEWCRWTLSVFTGVYVVDCRETVTKCPSDTCTDGRLAIHHLIGGGGGNDDGGDTILATITTTTTTTTTTTFCY